ncbi:hypothetical protein TTHERM_00693010 (macronuclear) [Tetrahymena thermophila SB210]|uniref:Uncharacterized protein n=1 Tax=Tetrahymena thermophila (strain SB210) TaxID=312017 RepID=Q245B5_TETTS|nr:hypothetical protein TTHERM_00693010 [Tetrahymena thermophila SB210]EAS03322.1 hypothetical protein TTHERM_00693010 [Tetrahymena thermophila SB210]|eukprot:XP_001023567.1 hypothetical protein TTHERM_00693010 [Tetrahymena thermophila SB210]
MNINTNSLPLGHASQKTSDSFVIEEFFKGHKDIFNSKNNYNLAIDSSSQIQKNLINGSTNNLEGSTKEEDPQQIQETINQQTDNQNSQHDEECLNQIDCENSLNQNEFYKKQEALQKEERNHGSYLNDLKHYQEKDKDEENKRALQTFKFLLQKSNNNIDESGLKDEIVPFQQDISQIDPKYEQNHTYNLENENTEYILRNAEKYLDSPDYDQEDQQNDKKHQYLPEDYTGNIPESFEEKQKDSLFLSQIKSQKQQIQDLQMQEREENEISFHQDQNQFTNQINENQTQINAESKLQQDTSPLHKSDSQITFERCQNIEKIIEEYERSIQNLSSVEEQPAVLKSRSDLKLQSRSNSKQQDQMLEKQSSQSSINQAQKAPSSILTPSKQNSNTSIASKPPKDQSKRESNLKLNNQESQEKTEKDIKYQFQIQLLESENQDLKQQIHQVQLEKEALQLKIDRLESKNESLTKNMSQFKEKLSLIASIDSEISSNLEILSVENQELSSQNEQFQQQINALTNQSNALQFENKNLLESIKNMKTQIQYFQEKLDEKFDILNSEHTNKNKKFQEDVIIKFQNVKESISNYIHQNSDLNQISKEVLKAYAPQKLQTKIDIKIKQIEKNSQSYYSQIDQSLDNLLSLINDFTSNIDEV